MFCEPYDYMVDEPDDDRDGPDDAPPWDWRTEAAWDAADERYHAAIENGFDDGEVRYW